MMFYVWLPEGNGKDQSHTNWDANPSGEGKCVFDPEFIPIVKDRSHIIVDAISADFGCLGQPPIPFLFLLDTQVL